MMPFVMFCLASVVAKCEI